MKCCQLGLGAPCYWKDKPSRQWGLVCCLRDRGEECKGAQPRPSKAGTPDPMRPTWCANCQACIPDGEHSYRA